MLNSRRNTFTFIANLTVLAIAAIFFKVAKTPDAAFEYLAIFVVSIGLCASTFFLINIREVPLVKVAT